MEGSPGAPWDQRKGGRLDKLVVESELLRGNPLDDPYRRPLYVYVPEGVDDSGSYPSIYMIQGFTGQLDMWFDRNAFEPTMIERLDALFADESVPRAIVVFVDAWTRYGGSQFINSVSTGPYMDYLCDEIPPFVDERYPTHPDAARRGLTGKSSGGYGAMVVAMKRSDVFNALASHAGDALFESCYAADFREAVRDLRDKFDGSTDVFWDRVSTAERFSFDEFGKFFEIYGYAVCYSPDEKEPGKALLPFDTETGRLVDDVWAKWLEWDPVRMIPKHLDGLRKMKLIYLDAGKSDEWYLDLGAQAVAKELSHHGIDHTIELFDGKHGGIQYRYPKAIRALAEALSD